MALTVFTLLTPNFALDMFGDHFD